MAEENIEPNVPEIPESGKPWMRSLLYYSVTAGFCPLIPLPWLDDWALRYVRRRMTGAVLRSRTYSPTDERVYILADGNEARGCLRDGCLMLPFKALYAIIVYPIRKIFRMLFFFLLVKACVDTTSSVFHHGYLLNVALDEDLLSDDSDDAAALRLYETIDEVCETTDTRPVNQIVGRVIGTSWSTIKRNARSFRTFLSTRRRAPETGKPEFDEGEERQREENQLDGLLDELELELLGSDAYLRKLETVLRETLAAADPQ